MEEFVNQYGDEDGQNRLLYRLQKFVGNILGTDPYWKSTFWEFRDTSFYYEYMDKCSDSLFHTGSVSNFHDPHLYNIMANDVDALDGKYSNL